MGNNVSTIDGTNIENDSSAACEPVQKFGPEVVLVYDASTFEDQKSQCPFLVMHASRTERSRALAKYSLGKVG